MSLTLELQTVPLKADSDGVMRVGKTRIPLDTVVHAFESGHTAEEIVSHYPALSLADVYAVITYYLNHQADVQQYLQEQKQLIQKNWAKIEANKNYKTFRERLLARRDAVKRP